MPPYPEDKSSLPNGVYVLKTYTELKDRSRNVSVVLQNLTSKTIHLAPGRCIARVAAANEVPEAVPSPELVKDLEEALPKEAPKLTIEERQKLLMELLRQDGGLEQLKEWPPELALKFERMLMEHHHIFSLDKNEIGCMDTAEHIIELMDDKPFKERFQQIAPPLLEEVRENLQDMLDGAAIRPSKSPWCNAIVLVHKKRWNTPVLYRFSEAECQDQEGFVPSTPHAGDHGVHGRSPILFQYGSEIWVLAGTNIGKVPAVYRLHCGKPRCVQVPSDAIRVV